METNINEEGDEEIRTQDDEDVEEQVDKFFAELDIDQERQKRRLKSDGTRAPRRRSTLPSHLHAVMGSANLSLARGDTAAAIELCLEVIRQAPHVVEPFLTLATVYEDTGEREKLLQILLIAANLKRSDHDLWIKVADLATELQQLTLAAQCLSKAFRFDSENLSLLWRKGNIYQELENWKKAAETYDQLRQSLPADNSKEHIEVAKELARIYHIQREDIKAIEVLQTAKQNYLSAFDDEATNILTELLISARLFSDALELITDFYKIPLKTTTTPTHHQSMALPTTSHREPLTLSAALSLSMSTSDVLDPLTGSITSQPSLSGPENKEIEILEVPDTLPIDLRSKLSVCLINLRYKLPENILASLAAFPEEYGDLLLDVSEAHMENAEYSKALPLLTLLTETHNFNQAGVWLKHAECHHMLNDLEQAALSYAKVLSLAPHHTETRMTLASLYSQLGMTEDALALLVAEDSLYTLQQSQSSESDRELHSSASLSVSHDDGPSLNTQISSASSAPPPQLLSQDVRLLFTKFKLLEEKERVPEFVEVGAEMLIFYFRDFFHRNDLKELFGYKQKAVRYKMKSSRAMEGPETLRPPEEEKALKEQENHISKDDWWKIFMKTCNGLYNTVKEEDRSLLLKLVMCADISKKFDQYERSLQFLSYQVCLHMKEYNYAFQFMRLLYFRGEEGSDKWHNSLFWTLFNRIPPTQRQQKFVLRRMFKDPNHPSLLRISANYSLIASSYKFALAQYEMAYKQNSEDYILCLCIAVVYANLSLQKHSLHRNTLVVQSVSFLYKYMRLRGDCQESYYNVARLFHQLGLVHISCQYYKKVLFTEPDNSITKSKEVSELADLKKEAAFNLSLIYRNSDNPNLALYYIRKYCTI